MRPKREGASRRRGRPRKLVRESRWLRVYEDKPNVFVERSRFLENGVELNADEFEKEWPQLSLRERLDLCAAYRGKRHISKDDERILNIIMERGDEATWGNIASVLTRHTDRPRVSTFLRNRIEEQQPPLANFYHAVEILGDESAIPLLQKKYQEYRDVGLSPASHDQMLCVDYLTCCRALWKLTTSAEYRRAIEEYADARSKLVRDSARRLLQQP